MSHHQNVGQNCKDSQDVLKCGNDNKKNLNLIHEKIKNRLNLGNACYYSVWNLLSSCLLPKNVKDENIQNYNFAWV
jgi:hypothetical protein